jgi:hypothetical protein
MRSRSLSHARSTTLLALALAAGSAASAQAQCVSSFLTAINYAAGTRPYSIAYGDFNGDGKPDLAIANATSNDLSILINDGTGAFLPAVPYPAGNSPASVAIADFNNDGKLDVVVANFAASTVVIFIGNGDGTFQPAVPYATAQFPSSVVVGDFNADGKPDLAVAASGAGVASILLGNGDGTFKTAVNYTTGPYPIALATADLNADGKLDLALADNSNNTITILLGNGDGSFQSATFLPAGANPTGIAIADLNADGEPDLVVSDNAFGESFNVYLGNGDGTFATRVPYGTGNNQPIWITVGDFNGDAKPDVAVANLLSNNISVFQGSGSGTFAPQTDYAMGTRPQSIVAVDVNNDGRLDIVGAAQNGVWVLPNNAASNPAPTFTMQPLASKTLYQAGQNITIAALADGHGSTATYQWRRNGVNLIDTARVSGSTTTTLTITNAALTDTAQYDVVASTPACGSGQLVTNSNAMIIPVTDAGLCQPPAITQQPVGVAVSVGASAAISVTANATTGVTYQWRRNGVNLTDGPTPAGSIIAGSATSTISISQAALGDNAAAFDVILTTTCGAVRSIPAGLAVVAAPTCYPNCDGSTTIPLLSSADFVCFLAKFRQGCP